MDQLNRTLLEGGFKLPENVTLGKVDDLPERVIQFGEGNFLRAFADWMIDKLNQKNMFNDKVVVVQPIKVGIAHLVNDQDGLYTLIMRGLSKGQVVEERHIVGSVSRGIDPYEDWKTVLKCAQNPDLRFMLSNTTEAGIVYEEEAYKRTECPNSFPAKVTSFLYERYNAFDGDPDKGLVIIPCELIERNGDSLKRKVLKHARTWELEKDFSNWINESNFFLNTLVDRIVPGFPGDEIEKLTNELGYDDRLLVTSELFHLWVIEGPKHLAEEIPFHKIGLNVVWTDNLTPYRERKVRILNGAHTSSVLASYLGGLNSVLDMMNDDVFGTLLRQVVFNEILPTLSLDEKEKKDYAEAVLERFQNPFMHHKLLSISLNSVSKWRVRVLPSLQEYTKKMGRFPTLLTFSLAALLFFYKGVGTAKRELRGRRNEERYAIRDDLDVLSHFEKRWYAFSRNQDIRALVATLLANDELWGVDLTLSHGFIDAVSFHLQKILINGTRHAAETCLNKEGS